MQAPRIAPLALLALAAACDGRLALEEHAPEVTSLASPITDGVTDTGHHAVGYLRAGDSVGCTGTLVGRKAVLVAAHCVWSDHTQVFVLEGAEYSSASSVTHPSYDAKSHMNDIGLVLLGRAAHVVPTALATLPGRVGDKITLVGFGATSEGASDVGGKRTATNTIASLHPTSFNFAGTGKGAGNVCHKDSGGPVYAGASASGAQLGVIIGGQAPCGTLGIATRVDTYLAWLRSGTGNDLVVAGEAGAFGFPCGHATECKSGVCAADRVTGDQYCSVACSGDEGACPEGARCEGVLAGQRFCALPDPPESDEGGCTLGAAGRGGSLPCALLLLAARALLGRTRRLRKSLQDRASAGHGRARSRPVPG